VTRHARAGQRKHVRTLLEGEHATGCTDDIARAQVGQGDCAAAQRHGEAGGLVIARRVFTIQLDRALVVGVLARVVSRTDA
jgi:hypothetical protein